MIRSDTSHIFQQITLLADASPGSRWMVSGQGQIAKDSRSYSLFERTREWLSSASRTKQSAVEYEFIRLLASGASSNLFNDPSHLKQIAKAAIQVGLIKGNRSSENSHPELNALIELIGKQIANQPIDAQTYDQLIEKFYQKNQSRLKVLFPAPVQSADKPVLVAIGPAAALAPQQPDKGFLSRLWGRLNFFNFSKRETKSPVIPIPPAPVKVAEVAPPANKEEAPKTEVVQPPIAAPTVAEPVVELPPPVVATDTVPKSLPSQPETVVEAAPRAETPADTSPQTEPSVPPTPLKAEEPLFTQSVQTPSQPVEPFAEPSKETSRPKHPLFSSAQLLRGQAKTITAIALGVLVATPVLIGLSRYLFNPLNAVEPVSDGVPSTFAETDQISSLPPPIVISTIDSGEREHINLFTSPEPNAQFTSTLNENSAGKIAPDISGEIPPPTPSLLPTQAEIPAKDSKPVAAVDLLPPSPLPPPLDFSQVKVPDSVSTPSTSVPEEKIAKDPEKPNEPNDSKKPKESKDQKEKPSETNKSEKPHVDASTSNSKQPDSPPPANPSVSVDSKVKAEKTAEDGRPEIKLKSSQPSQSSSYTLPTLGLLAVGLVTLFVKKVWPTRTTNRPSSSTEMAQRPATAPTSPLTSGGGGSNGTPKGGKKKKGGAGKTSKAAAKGGAAGKTGSPKSPPKPATPTKDATAALVGGTGAAASTAEAAATTASAPPPAIPAPSPSPDPKRKPPVKKGGVAASSPKAAHVPVPPSGTSSALPPPADTPEAVAAATAAASVVSPPPSSTPPPEEVGGEGKVGGSSPATDDSSDPIPADLDVSKMPITESEISDMLTVSPERAIQLLLDDKYFKSFVIFAKSRNARIKKMNALVAGPTTDSYKDRLAAARKSQRHGTQARAKKTPEFTEQNGTFIATIGAVIKTLSQSPKTQTSQDNFKSLVSIMEQYLSGLEALQQTSHELSSDTKYKAVNDSIKMGLTFARTIQSQYKDEYTVFCYAAKGSGSAAGATGDAKKTEGLPPPASASNFISPVMLTALSKDAGTDVWLELLKKCTFVEGMRLIEHNKEYNENVGLIKSLQTNIANRSTLFAELNQKVDLTLEKRVVQFFYAVALIVGKFDSAKSDPDQANISLLLNALLGNVTDFAGGLKAFSDAYPVRKSVTIDPRHTRIKAAYDRTVSMQQLFATWHELASKSLENGSGAASVPEMGLGTGGAATTSAAAAALT